ncbi:MAG: hypothetical protein HLUCCO16_14380 [Phormidium sp. OSCR]|nr:MAG: hypothetical protein HLUCCO16_14380 [Phormidium sp. OSCR]
MLRFPSPCGEKIGKDLKPKLRLSKREKRVSVPLRGKDRKRRGRYIEWLIKVAAVSVPLRGKDRKRQHKEVSGSTKRGFPSPCGEKIGKDGTRYLWGNGKYESLFPSPCGEKIGKDFPSHYLEGERKNQTVSVPLRGKDRKRRFETPSSTMELTSVSVPLRGKDRKRRYLSS